MRAPLLTLVRRELRLNPHSMLGPVLVAASAAVFAHAAAVFALRAAGPEGRAWRAEYAEATGEAIPSVGEDIAGAAMILTAVAIPTIIVLGSVGSAVVRSMSGALVRWRLAGVTPAQSATVVVGQVLASAVVGACLGVLVSLPLLPTLMDPVFTMAAAGDATPAASVASAGMAVAAVAGISLFGTIRPARTVGTIQPSLVLRDVEVEPRRPGVARAVVAAGLAAGACAMIGSSFGISSGTDTSSAFNNLMGAGSLLICAIAAGAPWIVPALARVLAAIPSAASPAFFVAHKRISAHPRQATSATLPVFVAAGMASMFSGMLGTWQRALTDSGSTEQLNTSDTIVLLTPPAVIGIVGAACHMLLARNRWLTEFAKLRVAGMRPRAVIGSSVAEAVLGACVVLLLSLGVSAVVATLTAHALTVTADLAARPATDWALIGAIVAVGMAATAAVNLSAALAANRGNPREKLARAA
ncbi:MAG: hypothetical protein Q3979_07525 [Actinomycetaceae bacterium]|nr:hypothetical protein [Actinomycetaceae bacterium]